MLVAGGVLILELPFLDRMTKRQLVEISDFLHMLRRIDGAIGLAAVE